MSGRRQCAVANHIGVESMLCSDKAILRIDCDCPRAKSVSFTAAYSGSPRSPSDRGSGTGGHWTVYDDQVYLGLWAYFLEIVNKFVNFTLRLVV